MSFKIYVPSKINILDEIIDDIEKIRTRNNINWMNLLRIVAVEAPDSLTTITSEINATDGEISKLLARLAQQ